MKPAKIVQSKKSTKNENQNLVTVKSQRNGGNHNKVENKSKSGELLNHNNSQRKAIREQKLTELSKKKWNRSQNRKKYQKSQAQKSGFTLDHKLDGLKAETQSLNNYIIDRYDSCIDSSCKSSVMSDTASEYPANSMNFSLFDEFRFSHSTSGTRQYCQDSIQGNENPIDDLCSNFDNNLYFDAKRADEYASLQPPYNQMPGKNKILNNLLTN